MPAAALVPLAEYLEQTYHPDCEYIDGALRERNAGAIGHSDAQTALCAYARTQTRGFWSGVEVRVQIRPDRFRIPDVSIVRGGRAAGRVITAPPEVAVEVLSPDDRASDIQDKIDGYLGCGIPCVWGLRPETQRAWIHTLEGAREAKDGMLREIRQGIS